MKGKDGLFGIMPVFETYLLIIIRTGVSPLETLHDGVGASSISNIYRKGGCPFVDLKKCDSTFLMTE